MRTPLYNEIINLNAKMVDFHGWDMPIQFTGIIEEHRQVRSSAGLFDVSHMGDITIEGRDAQEFMTYLFPTDISKEPVGKAIYSAYLNQDANMIDDTIIYKEEENKYLVVPNAATTEKVYNWIVSNRKSYDVRVNNLSDRMSCLALQGPKAPEVMESIFPEANKLGHFTFIGASTKYPEKGLETATVVGRTGYTGEDGFEFVVPNKYSVGLWREILKNPLVKPIGLGARDTLRMEKGFLLSGQDFNEDRNPIEAGVSWIISWDHDFIGKKRLLEKKGNVEERFRGVVASDKIIPRTGSVVKRGDEIIGKLTSGSFSPTLSKGIGLGYVNSDAELDTEVTIQTRNIEGKGILKKPRMV
ncbi:MAG: glycine cleavage system aminomethyltransferase GcvT [Candidatus Thermoplasmatota archaeon]|jgi:aminomethyltransferase|nr:glycine cleavage system aminomethyltransferase GcvT [Candidatus Thermoplasmatota archaeon]MCL5789242.1 glycine cleavage system aminomethyltransferase GcvT [Candidatus Thermoplasmatota archaeon]